MGVSKKRKAQAIESSRDNGRRRPLKKTKITKEVKFEDKFRRVKILGDGNCLFRFILYSIMRDDTYHYDLRQDICNYMLEHREDYDGFITSGITFNDYIAG